MSEMRDIEHTLSFMRDKAEDYAEAKANRVYLQEFRKSKKSILRAQAEKNGLKTQHQKDDYAYSHPEYIEVLEGLKVATEIEEKLRLQVEAAKLRVEVWRTENANSRVERKAYGA